MKYWRRLGAISPTLCEDSGWKTQILAEGVLVNKKLKFILDLAMLISLLGLCSGYVKMHEH